MAEPKPSVVTRLAAAFTVFWRTLSDPAFAAAVIGLRSAGPIALSEAAAGGPRLLAAEPNGALQLLGLLQQEGRLIDFLEEDVAAYSDAEIGAAVRVVHEGCRRTLRQHFTLEPVRGESEGSRVTLPEGFDPAAVRLAGRVVGEAPFTGTLVHKGWRVTAVTLPRVASAHDLSVVAPAEVEL